MTPLDPWEKAQMRDLSEAHKAVAVSTRRLRSGSIQTWTVKVTQPPSATRKEGGNSFDQVAI